MFGMRRRHRFTQIGKLPKMDGVVFYVSHPYNRTAIGPDETQLQVGRKPRRVQHSVQRSESLPCLPYFRLSTLLRPAVLEMMQPK